jgi:hypothetical protein
VKLSSLNLGVKFQTRISISGKLCRRRSPATPLLTYRSPASLRPTTALTEMSTISIDTKQMTSHHTQQAYSVTFGNHLYQMTLHHMRISIPVLNM